MMAKFRSLMPSLALIFHLIEVADGTAAEAVTLRSAQLAAQWCDYLETHARRIYGLVNDLGIQAATVSQNLALSNSPKRKALLQLKTNVISLLRSKTLAVT